MKAFVVEDGAVGDEVHARPRDLRIGHIIGVRSQSNTMAKRG
jgi:hypothetical protein